ncbi:MAG: CPBP family intramembrane metalloprotease [Defluviitaleaceae bacterium]|nr:CPBP family intramembrane metalloprotease [Defluviitaleaceae bacterium]
MVRVGGASAATANIFMFFLLSYNVFLLFIFLHLYENVWRGTPFGAWIASPWSIIVTQILGLLVPMFIFKAIVRAIAKDRDENEIKEDNYDNAVDLSTIHPKIQKKPLDFINIVLIIALSLLAQPTMMILSGLASLVIPNPIAYVMTELTLIPFPMALLIIALTPSICEEWVFRGFIQSHYEGHSVFAMAIVNGLFFAIIHLNLHQFTYTFFMGIFFVYLVHITRSVFAGVLSHFAINASQFSLSYILTSQMDVAVVTTEPTTAELLESIYELMIVNIFILPILVALFWVLIKHNQRKNDEDLKELVDRPPKSHPFDKFFWAVVLLFAILMI